MYKMNKSKAEFGEIRHHYWEWMIATYLFLGGLGGGILGLTAILTLFVYPEASTAIQAACAWPCFIAILCLGFGCVLLVLDLGQPLLFYRAFIKSTSVICWGGRVLSVALIFGFIWFLSFIPWDWFAPVANFLVPAREVLLAIAGLGGLCVVLYTGIFLSSLKAHSFWATPALPVLFTISALSTACAAIALSIGWWPMDQNFLNEAYVMQAMLTNAPDATAAVLGFTAVEEIKHLLHLIDVILVVCEVVVLLVMVLSFLGAGNVTQNKAAHRWVDGDWALLFWIGMIGVGLVVPEVLYIAFSTTWASTVLAPILVLCGGCLLRFLIVYSDDRQPLPGEKIYYGRLVGDDAEFLHKWTYGKNIF